MDSAKNSITNSYIFLWRIENFKYFVREMSSPVFYAQTIDSEFRLKLDFHKQYSPESVISFYLQSIQAYPAVKLNFELSFMALDGSPLISKEKRGKQFAANKQHGFLDFAVLRDVIERRNADFLPQGTLTLKCKIWKDVENFPESIVCFAETRVGIEQLSFVWPIERFYSVTGDEVTLPYSVRTASVYEPVLSMNFQMETAYDGPRYEVELKPEKNIFTFIRENTENTNGKVGFYDFKLTFVHASGDEELGQETNRLECNDTLPVHILPVWIETEILEEGNGYLVNGTLTLKFRFVFYKGIISEGIVRTVYGSGAMLEHLVPL